MFWGVFGSYSYLWDQVVGGILLGGGPLSMVVTGEEAILLELAVNMP
jgi:hypothetical protein